MRFSLLVLLILVALGAFGTCGCDEPSPPELFPVAPEESAATP
jgi:hypothetical protein